MTLQGFSPSILIIDLRSGYLTREAQVMFAEFVKAINGSGAVITIDGEQTLTGKTIDGDNNTLRDIATASLKRRSGDSSTVATGHGTSGYVAVWDANGDLGDGLEATAVLLITDAMNSLLRLDGGNGMVAPLKLQPATVATVPAAASYTGGMIYVSDESGGAVPAFSDGTNWLRVTDRAVIS